VILWAGRIGVSEKTYRSWRPDQAWLLPPSPQDWLPEGHLVYFLMDAVRELDIGAITAHYERELRGYPPFHPRMMLTLLIFGYATGTRSSRKIMQRCEQDVACRVIVGEDTPDFHAISEFRRRHLAAFETLFVEVLRLAAASGLLKVGRLALDGTKIKANASRHKAMSYDRMQTEEVRLQNEIHELLAQAEAEDQAEDAQHGANRRGDELPAELHRRESRLKKIREARAALEAEARARAAAENAAREAEGKGPKHADLDQVRPEPKAQRNFTDPDSRIMPASNKGWDQSGNAQVLVDESQLILAADVTQQANDVQQVAPLLDQLEAHLQAAEIVERPKEFVADAGYYSDDNTQCVLSHEMVPYIATQRLKHHEELPPVPRGRIPKSLTPKQRMARTLRTKKGRATYKKRKGQVEPVFGQIKQAGGFRQFAMRGLSKMKAEWQLVCLTHNLLKLWRAAPA
jgi:transposase